jgi:hypothetical protein
MSDDSVSVTMLMNETVVTATPAHSRRAIATATLVALAVAAVVLVTAVLPAEFGVDPLGTGQALGLLSLSAGVESVPTSVVPAAGGPLRPLPPGLQADATEFLLLPSGGFVEYHYRLAAGATMVYDWKATGMLSVDFHTQPDGKPPEASETFEKGDMAAGSGVFVSPYAGLHGWYWENKTNQSVRITLSSSGFYTEATEYRDDGTSAPHELKGLVPPKDDTGNAENEK